MGGISTTEGEPRLFMETESIPSVSTTVKAFEHLLLDNNYAAFENKADNIDDWRNQVVTRLNIYAAKVNNIQNIANTVVFNSDATYQSFSSVSARLDHFSKLIDVKNQRISDNSLKIQSLACSFNQFKVDTETQLLSLESICVRDRLIHQAAPVVTIGTDQDEVVEGLCGKVKGLEKQAQTHLKVLERWWLD